VNGFFRSRWPAYVVGLGVVVAAALPAFRPATRDGYPFSTYPMFTDRRDEVRLAVVERIDHEGRVGRVSPALIGSNNVMQAHAMVQRSVGRGPEAALELCRSIAERISKREHGKKRVAVRVVRAHFNPVAYFVAAAEPRERKLIAECSAGGR
jgi:hypothetical protein